MNREILFRGQTRKRGEKVNMAGEPVDGNWVYGGIFQGTGDYSIIYGSTDPDNITADNLKKYVVYTDTVGQYTGLTDKNGVKIFKGDIVRLIYDGKESILVVVWDYSEVDFKATNGKKNYGSNANRMPMRSHELILVFYKPSERRRKPIFLQR